MDGQTPFTNRLAGQTSPYLRQHATNPVDWHPWGDEAFARATAEDKPIFLSIGYSSCHWCHVMAHESFENPAIAAIMNRAFVCIKVDREELPDIDALYMTATQLMTQRGGWPNSIWLTPDRRPWYAGTYFPPEDRHGRLGFSSLLQQLARIWKEKRPDVEKQADTLTEAMRAQHQHDHKGISMALTPTDFVRHIQHHYGQQFDPRYGGFGDAPKFPPHAGILLLVQLQHLEPSEECDTIIKATLDAMSRGGIYDQIGGGFHRYATDDHWLLPHFEKMLYDNALLLKAYARAYQRYALPAYRRIVVEIADWLAREMTHPEGGFYSALDADSEGEEGKFYTWSQPELASLLLPDELEAFGKLYHIEPHGNFRDEASGQSTGLNIPHLPPASTEEQIERMSPLRLRLRLHRDQRKHPGLDHKVITAWNGLAISALAFASQAIAEPQLLQMALNARRFIQTYMVNGERLARSWCDGIAQHDGVLDDVAAIALADIDLFEATHQSDHLQQAQRWTRNLLDQFYDPETHDLYMTPHHAKVILIRLRDVFDQGSPSGMGLAAQAIVRLSRLTQNHEMEQIGRSILARVENILQRLPSATATLCEAYAIAAHDQTGSKNNHPSSVTFICQPAMLSLSPNGLTPLTISARVPPGWSFHQLGKDEQGEDEFLRISIHEAHGQIRVIKHSVNDLQWHTEISFPPGHMQPLAALTVAIQYQLCSDRECLPAQTQLLQVKIEQSAG